ncbi:MAG: hypothetical protein V5A23_09375 [Halobacteriales archaeon]
MPTVSAADPADDHLEEVLKDPKVRSLESAVGGFDVGDVTVKHVDTEEITLTGTWIETEVGTLALGETEDGRTAAKLDFADLVDDPSLRKRLPSEHRGVPNETGLLLYGHESSVSLARTVTDQERQQLQKAIPEPDSEYVAATCSSDIDGYTAITEDARYRVGEGGRGISPQHVEQLAGTAGCWDWCGQCASWAAGKGICYLSCYAAVSLVGAVACVLCIASTNMALIWAGPGCGNCFQNCT